MAIFASLSEKLGAITAKMRGKARITEADLKAMMREIRLALLEADVNYKLVKDFCKEIETKALGEEVLKSLTPGQQVVKVVRDELISILGQEQSALKVSPSGFTVILLYGLQGSGKTTAAAKLARLLKQGKKKVMLTSVDVYRPAAQEQLAILAKEVDTPIYLEAGEKDAVKIAKNAVENAKYLLCDTLIVDTAGRMTIDEAMMAELTAITEAVHPTERLLLIDAMIGQEAVNIAQAFEAAVGIDGIILSKLDGDARGGAALSLRKLTGKPIKLIGVGEKIDAFEFFYPERMADRILGMGDVLSLIEKAEQNFDEETAQKTLEDLQKNRFDLNTLLLQFQQMKKMGSLQDMVGMLPGMRNSKIDASQLDNRQIDYFIAIIQSMTKAERRQPKLLDASRRKRIAQGSGRSVMEVNRLMKQFEQMAKMMKQFQGKRGRRGLARMAGLLGGGQLPF